MRMTIRPKPVPSSTKMVYPGILWCVILLASCDRTPQLTEQEQADPRPAPSPSLEVHPEDNLQEQIDQAARDGLSTVVLREGTYAPTHPGMALLILTGRHDGLTIRGKPGERVVLTAANEPLADPRSPSFPAVVNHVLLVADGVTSRTRLQNLILTGANGFASKSVESLEQNYPEYSGGLTPGLFFLLDGGAIKVFGNSTPVFANCVIERNQTLLCGGGISIEQQFRATAPVEFHDCIFRNNHCPATGAAVDVLAGGRATFDNCLFVSNIANTGMDEIAGTFGLTYNEKHGCGALTVFPQSQVQVRRCTFTNNWNGVDDHGQDSEYRDSIFWMNDAWNQSRPGQPYELDVPSPGLIIGCAIHGQINDLQHRIDPVSNLLNAPNPDFDVQFVPRNPEYVNRGYRPTGWNPDRQEPSNDPI